MTRMCCLGCAGAIRGEHVIEDDKGRRWRFEWHPYFGPAVLRADGQPKARQPGSRSPFWRALDAWRARQEDTR